MRTAEQCCAVCICRRYSESRGSYWWLYKPIERWIAKYKNCSPVTSRTIRILLPQRNRIRFSRLASRKNQAFFPAGRASRWSSPRAPRSSWWPSSRRESHRRSRRVWIWAAAGYPIRSWRSTSTSASASSYPATRSTSWQEETSSRLRKSTTRFITCETGSSWGGLPLPNWSRADSKTMKPRGRNGIISPSKRAARKDRKAWALRPRRSALMSRSRTSAYRGIGKKITRKSSLGLLSLICLLAKAKSLSSRKNS